MDAALPEPLLSAVSRRVESQLGLHFPRERWADLERGVRAAAAELGIPAADYARELAAAALGREQADALAAHLTVGETYFFRDPAAFETLTSQLIPALMQERQGPAKRLRIWSAGCCTGEEPYSIAIALRRALPTLCDWPVTILATDINSRFLHKATEGVYGPWSFRGVSEDLRSAYFRRTPEGRFEVLPEIRKMVTFTCLNLVEDVYPALTNNTNAMDIIFCRNVLMYFSREQLRKAVAKLHAALVEGGHLLVSASEASQELFGGFSSAEIPGIALYRKGPVPERPARVRPPVPRVISVPQVASPSRKESQKLRSKSRTQPLVVKAKTQPLILPDFAAEARRLANEGKLAEALVACDRALKTDKLVAAHHYLRGVILQEQDEVEKAVEAFQRALYLDHEFVVAHFALGHLRLRQSRSREAARCFANARGLLQGCLPDSLLPESDGITAGRLLAILTSMEEALA
jgi:chemotaxis protein methyltransferase CheR